MDKNQNNNLMVCGLCALSLAVGVGAGTGIGAYLWKSAKPVEAEPSTEARVQITSNPSDIREIDSLRRQLRELKRQLGEKASAPAAELVDEIAVARVEEPPEERRERRGERGERGERWGRNFGGDWSNGVARMRQNWTNHIQTRMDKLASVDSSRLSPEALAVHTKLRETLARREELGANMENMFTLSGEDRAALFQELGTLQQEITGLYRQERQNLLTQTARDLGLSDADAASLVETIGEINEATDENELSRLFGGPGGRGGRGGPGGFGGRNGGRRGGGRGN